MLSCPSFSKSQLLCRFTLLLSGTACFQNPIERPRAALPKSQVFSMRTVAQVPMLYPCWLNYEFTGFIHASVVSLIQRNPEFRPCGNAEKPCKYRSFPRKTPCDFAPYGNRRENRENAYSRNMNLLVNTHLFAWIFCSFCREQTDATLAVMRSAVRSRLSPPEKSWNLTISGLFLYFPPQIIDRIFAVMRPDPDLTQTGAKTWWIYRDLFDKTARVSLFSRIFWTF